MLAEQLGKRLVRVRDASTFDEQPREKRTIGGLPRRAQVIGTHGAPTVAKQIGHSEGTFGAPSGGFRSRYSTSAGITPVDEIAEHVHGTPVVPGRYLDAGDELDAVFGTCRDGGRQAGEGIVIGERDDGQSAGLDWPSALCGRVRRCRRTRMSAYAGPRRARVTPRRALLRPRSPRPRQSHRNNADARQIGCRCAYRRLSRARRRRARRRRRCHWAQGIHARWRWP